MKSSYYDYFTHRPGHVASGEYLFVSTVGGFDPTVGSSLQQILDGSTIPKIVFWLGDMSATKILTDLERMFNDISETMKRLLEQDSEPSDWEILNTLVRDHVSISVVCREMCDILEEIDPRYSYEHTVDLAWQAAKSKSFNQFIYKLHHDTKKKIRNIQTENAVDYIHLMTQFAEKGCQVIIVEGDKDINCPFNFHFKDLIALANEKIQYVDQPKVIKNEDYIFVIWPYNSQPSDIPHLNNPSNKKVIVVSHSPFVYEAVMGFDPADTNLTYYLTKQDEVIDNHMMNVAGQLNAIYGVHGHLHRQIDCGNYDAYCVAFTTDQGPGYFSAYFIHEGIKAINFN